MNQSGAADLIYKQLWPAMMAEREKLDKIDRWYRWEHDNPHTPQISSSEYRELMARALTPWLTLVVTSCAQQLYLDGYRGARESENRASWKFWQANRMDARQIAVHRAALAYGLSYVSVLPGVDMFGAPMPVMRGIDPSELVAFYDDPAFDEWPRYALRAEAATFSGTPGYILRLIDDTSVWRFHAKGLGGSLEYITVDDHNLEVCPIARFANMLDLKGRSPGEVEPLIPLAGRIDQTTFDRLVVQRFGAFVVRTIAGMSPPDRLEGETEDEWRKRNAILLRVSDLLVADDPDTKFGSLPATSLDGFISAHEADVQVLAAVSQTPAHEMLGKMANLSAEALAAAESSLTRKVAERQHGFGESWEQVLRLAAHVAGDPEGARDVEAQVRWRDMESRSLAQAADALGKLAQMLGVPPEMLWEKIPGWTDQDVERAKSLAGQAGGLDQLMNELLAAQHPAG